MIRLKPKNEKVVVDINNALQVYPNPSINGIVKLTAKSIKKIEVSDMFGRTILLKAVNNTDNEELIINGSGLYFVKVTDSNGRIFTQKVFVK